MQRLIVAIKIYVNKNLHIVASAHRNVVEKRKTTGTSVIDSKLFRAGLGLSGHNLTEFCAVTGLDRARLSQFINHDVALSLETFQRMESFFSNRGIYFSENGVYEQREGNRTLTGPDGFRQLYEDYYHTVKDGGEVRLYNGVSRQVMEALGDEYLQRHIERMLTIKNKVTVKTLVERGDKVRFGKAYAAYKWLPPEHFKKGTLYIYGAKFAYVKFGDPITVQLTQDQDMADMLALLFDQAWEHLAEEILHEDNPS
jgi:hypothetical protein